ncbi:MAG TPA: S8/S53 family peptidase [Jiangellaceae bacterium]|nr:S8/S53 family peptidase [Jiangellaceae bacterium]
MAIRTTRDDPAFAERFITGVRARRAGRDDRTKFELVPDKYGGSSLAAVTQLLIRAKAEPDVRRILDAYGLEREPVPELDRKVIRLRNRHGDPIELAHLASNLRRQGVPISVNYLTPMGDYMKSVASPEKTEGAPVWPKGISKRKQKKSPVRVVIIDTGVYGARGDGWLTDLETKDNREDLDDSPRNGFLDLAAGHGSFCAGIVQQIVPEAQIVACKKLDSDGLAHELRVARALVSEVRKGLRAGQHVVVNLSFGAETADDERPIALDVALEIIDDENRRSGLDAIVVAAAGNFGHERPCFPAAFPTVTAVAALTQGMLPAEWSSRGAWVDVSTIGEGVRSTYVPGTESPSVDTDFEEFPKDAWALWSGTSFAAPQVAGAIAKIAIDEDLTPTEAKRRLLEDAPEIPLYGKQVEILPHI